MAHPEALKKAPIEPAHKGLYYVGPTDMLANMLPGLSRKGIRVQQPIGWDDCFNLRMAQQVLADIGAKNPKPDAVALFMPGLDLLGSNFGTQAMVPFLETLHKQYPAMRILVADSSRDVAVMAAVTNAGATYLKNNSGGLFSLEDAEKVIVGWLGNKGTMVACSAGI